MRTIHTPLILLPLTFHSASLVQCTFNQETGVPPEEDGGAAPASVRPESIKLPPDVSPQRNVHARPPHKAATDTIGNSARPGKGRGPGPRATSRAGREPATAVVRSTGHFIQKPSGGTSAAGRSQHTVGACLINARTTRIGAPSRPPMVRFPPQG